MADKIYYTTKYINSGLGCKIHFSNSHSFSCVNYTDENNTTIRPNKVYSGSPSSSPNLVMCRRWEYSYSKSTLPAGVTSLKCHRKSSLMDTIPANNQTIPVYIRTDSEPYFKIWLLVWFKWYYRRYDCGIFYGDEIWFEATYDSNYEVQSPEFYWTDANNVKHPITESTPLRVGIDVVGDIAGQNYINTPELRQYVLRFTGHEHEAEIEEPSEEDDGIGFTKYKSNMTLADGTTSVNLQEYIKVKRISSTNSAANARTPEFLSDKDTIYEGDKLQIYTDCSDLDSYVDKLCIYNYTKEIPCRNTGGISTPTVKYLVQNGQPGDDGKWNGWTETESLANSTKMITSLNYGTITVNNNVLLDISFKKKTWNEWDLINDPHARTYGQNSSDNSTMEIRDEGHALWWGIGETRFTDTTTMTSSWKHDRAILENLQYFPSNQIDVQEWCAFGQKDHTWNNDHCTVPEDRNWAWSGSITTQHDENHIGYLGYEGSASLYFYNETVDNKTQRARGLKVTWKQAGGQYYWAYRIGGIKLLCTDSYDPTK